MAGVETEIKLLELQQPLSPKKRLQEESFRDLAEQEKRRLDSETMKCNMSSGLMTSDCPDYERMSSTCLVSALVVGFFPCYFQLNIKFSEITSLKDKVPNKKLNILISLFIY